MKAGQKFRLPAILGGGECTFVADHFNGPYCRVTVGEGDDGLTVDLVKSHLTPIPDPLPPEPSVNSVVVVLDLNCGVQRVFSRERQQVDGWVTMAEDKWYTWAEINKIDGKPVLLVPDPLAEAPELPYTYTQGGWRANTKVEIDGRGDVYVTIVGTQLTTRTKVDRSVGLAIVAAYDRFKKENTGSATRTRP